MDAIFIHWKSCLNENKDVLEEFSQLRNDFEKVNYVHNLLNSRSHTLFDSAFGKQVTNSKKFRELGNVQYKEKNFDLALKLFTQSVGFAPINSVEHSLALGNRSACLLAMKNPVCALIDVERALAIAGLDSKYKEKLENRRLMCQEKLSSNNNETRRPPLLSSHNEYFSCASKNIQLAENEQVGRHLISNNPVKTGELLMIEEPFASALIPENCYSHCCNCFKYYECLIPCENCTTSFYCSKKCIEESKGLHELECGVNERLLGLKAGKMELLAMRILLVASQGGEKLDDLKLSLERCHKPANYNSMDFIRVYNLVGNSEKRSNMDLLKRTFISCVIVSALRSFTNFFSHSFQLESFAASVILRFLQNLPCNAHEISEFRNGEIIEVASAAYATFSLLNHSCDPNVVRQSYGKSVVLRAIRDIKENEELVDNYGYHYATHDLKARRYGLQQYYFTCNCIACSEDWPLYLDIPSEKPVFKKIDPKSRQLYNQLTTKFEEKLKLVLDHKVSVDTLDFLCQYLSFLDDTVHRPWQDYNKCQEAIKYCFNFFPDYSRRDS